VEFVVSSALLRAYVYGIPVPDVIGRSNGYEDPAVKKIVYSALQDLVVPPFRYSQPPATICLRIYLHRIRLFR